jgi:hypothetical protein
MSSTVFKPAALHFSMSLTLTPWACTQKGVGEPASSVRTEMALRAYLQPVNRFEVQHIDVLFLLNML